MGPALSAPDRLLDSHSLCPFLNAEEGDKAHDERSHYLLLHLEGNGRIETSVCYIASWVRHLGWCHSHCVANCKAAESWWHPGFKLRCFREGGREGGVPGVLALHIHLMWQRQGKEVGPWNLYIPLAWDDHLVNVYSHRIGGCSYEHSIA